jgi:hypothetical protein
MSMRFNNFDDEQLPVIMQVEDESPVQDVESPFVHRKMRLSPHKAKTTDKDLLDFFALLEI